MLTKQHIRFSETPGRNREPDGEQSGVTEEGNRLRGGYVRENEQEKEVRYARFY